MRLLLKLLGALLLVVLVIAGGGLAYLFLMLPRVSPPADLRIERTPARLARGEYLTNHVVGCLVCHSERDFSRYSAPVLPDQVGVGHSWLRSDGMPGNYWAINLTPTGLGQYTDGEIVRAMTEGIGKNGHALFPLMPYLEFRQLPTEEVYAIVAYLRSLPARPSTTRQTTRVMDFPLSLIVRGIPDKAAPLAAAPSDRVAYGRYLTGIASCGACHSPVDNGAIIEGREYSGGSEFPLPGGAKVRSANITPDQATGIGTWSEDVFIARFKNYEQASPETLALKSPRHNTEMPWTAYAGMTRDDLGAIYAYLRTVRPVVNRVAHFDD